MSATQTESIVWTKKSSQNNSDYEVGVEQSELDKPRNDTSHGGNPTAKHDFVVGVNWKFGNGEWTTTDDDIRRIAGITRYRLYKNDGSIYSFRLEFTNLEHYDYYFIDEEGDKYNCDTWSNSDHFIRYNSTKPTIVMIKGD